MIPALTARNTGSGAPERWLSHAGHPAPEGRNIHELDAEGNKQFIEGYDMTFFARYQTGANIDMKATAATYSPKTQDMIFDTMEASKEGRLADPNLVYTEEETKIFSTYQTDWTSTRAAYWQKFLLGDLEINDENWAKMTSEMAAFGEAEMIAASNAAYQRYLGN